MNLSTLQTACLCIENLKRFYQAADAAEQVSIMKELPNVVRLALVEKNYAMIERILLFCFDVKQKTDYSFGSLMHRFGHNRDDLKELLIFILSYRSQWRSECKPHLTQTLLAILAALLDDITTNHRFHLNDVNDACGQRLLIKAIENFPEAVGVLLNYGMNVNGKKQFLPKSEDLPPPLLRIPANRAIFPRIKGAHLDPYQHSEVAYPIRLSLDYKHPLFTAIERCHLHPESASYQLTLKQLLQHPSLELDHEDTITPLMFAAYLGDVSLLRILLKAGLDINQTDSLGHHALVYAMRSQQKEAIAFLVTEGSSLLLEAPSATSTTSSQDASNGCKKVFHVTEIQPYCTPEIKDFVTQFEKAYSKSAWLAVTHCVEQYPVQQYPSDALLPKKTLMQPKGYCLALHEVPSDGDCLYHAAVLYEPTKTAATLRSAVADFIQTGYFNAFLEHSSVQYAQNVRSGLWGGEIELNAIAILLNRPVIVLNETGEEPRVYQTSLPGLPIFISYNGINHYSGLLPEKGYSLAEVFYLFHALKLLRELPAPLVMMIFNYLPMSSLVPKIYICDDDKREITALTSQFAANRFLTTHSETNLSVELFDDLPLPCVEDDDPLPPPLLEHIFSKEEEDYKPEAESLRSSRKRSLSPGFFSGSDVEEEEASNEILQRANLEPNNHQDGNCFKKNRR